MKLIRVLLAVLLVVVTSTTSTAMAVEESVTITTPPPAAPASVTKMFQGLALCLGVFLVGAGIAKRFLKVQHKAGSKRMKICERMPLTAKTSVFLVEVDGATQMIAVGSERVSSLEVRKKVSNGFDFTDELEGVQCANTQSVLT